MIRISNIWRYVNTETKGQLLIGTIILILSIIGISVLTFIVDQSKILVCGVLIYIGIICYLSIGWLVKTGELLIDAYHFEKTIAELAKKSTCCDDES